MKNKEMKLKLNKKKIKLNMGQFILEVIKLRCPPLFNVKPVTNERLCRLFLAFYSE
jgi:hypothetical protein